MTILEKLDDLIAKYANTPDLTEIQGWKDEAQTLLLRENLAEHDVVRTFAVQLADMAQEMQHVLLTADSEKLPERKRERVLDKLALFKDFLSLLSASAELKKLQEKVDEELRYFKETYNTQ